MSRRLQQSSRYVTVLTVRFESKQFDPSRFQPGAETSVPTILLTNTTWWPCASRLAIALTKAGCKVAAIYPASGHPLALTSVINQSYRYSAVHPLDSLAGAIQSTKPDLIVPCDDRAVQHLHELHARENKQPGSYICRLIEQSIGLPATYPTVSTRYQLLAAALEEGLPVPHTELVVPGYSFSKWAAQHGFPWVLKADGTWGGHGTRIVRDQIAAETFVQQMSKPLSLGRALKRLVVDRDPFWILPWRNRSTPQIVIQSYVQGSPANCAVVCWKGRVLAGIAVDVACAQGETGSATIVRVIENPSMMRTAERLVVRLGLSGFLGFDFILEANTGTAYLIEMNPRVTPLSPFQLGAGRDLVSAISAQLTGERLTEVSPLFQNNLIAYFPQAWHWDRFSETFRASFHDVPWEEPALTRELLRLPWPDRSILARLANRVRGLTFEDRRVSGEAVNSALAKPGIVTAEDALQDPRRPPALVPLRVNGTKPPLFLIHGVDGHICRFYDLVRYLKSDQPVYGILSQGVLRERAALTRVEQLAAYYLKEIQAVHSKGPYHFFGYAFGGYLAFEMARQLYSRGEKVGVIGLIDVLPMGYPKDKLGARMLRAIYKLFDSAHQPIPAFLQSPYNLNWFAATQYLPESFRGKLTLFQIADSPECADSRNNLWANIAGQGVEVYAIPGPRDGILDEPQVRFLATTVTERLAKE